MLEVKYRRIFKWLSLDMLVFVLGNALLVFLFHDKFGALGDLTYLRLLVLGLAAYRAANILSNEPVTKPLRAPFIEEEQKDGKVVEQPKKTGFLGAMGLLIYCPSCTGVWLASVMVYCYVLFPYPTFLIALILALSAAERILAALVGSLKRES